MQTSHDLVPETFMWRGHEIRWGRHGAGPPVVMCHGTPWSSALWRQATEEMATSHTVYLWDMLGFGCSSMVETEVSLAVHAEVLRDLMHHWQLADSGAVDLVAHDIGGAVALRAHLLHGVGFGSLLLANIVALRPWGSPFFSLVHQHADVFAQLPPNLHRALVREYISGASAQGLAPTELDALVAPWITTAGQAGFYRQIAGAAERHTDDVESRLASITAPTKIVWGTDDTWIPVDRAHRLHELVPGSELALIPDSGHLIQLDAPDRFIAEVRNWLRR